MAFDGHICNLYIKGHSLVGHVCVLWEPYLFRGIWQYGEQHFAKCIHGDLSIQ